MFLGGCIIKLAGVRTLKNAYKHTVCLIYPPMMLLLAEVNYDPSLIAVVFPTLSLCLLFVSVC